MTLRRPILCLVTDRRRLAARLGLAPTGAEAVEALVGLVGSAVDAGVDLVQIREADLDGRMLCALTERAVRAARGSATRVVVNGRLDIALACGAAGVHLPGHSLPPDRVRDLGPPEMLVGQSLHDSRDVAAVRSLSYVVFGTVFPTASKPPGHPLAGTTGLAAASAATAVPVLAIGGVSLANVRSVAATGADGVAAVDLFLPPDLRPAPGWLHKIVDRVREAFDTRVSVS